MEEKKPRVTKGVLCEVRQIIRRDKSLCTFIVDVKDEKPHRLLCTLTRKKIYLANKVRDGAQLYMSGDVNLREYKDKLGRVHYENVFYVSEI